VRVNKFKFIILSLLFLFLVLISIGIFFYTFDIYRNKKNSSLHDFKIIYQDKNDEEGRTIIYSFGDYGLGGVGKQFKTPWIYIVGLFDKWEKIGEGPNYYIYFTEPFKKGVVYKVLVINEKTNFADLVPLEDKDDKPKPEVRDTILMIENLNKLKERDHDYLEILGSVTEYKFEELNQFFKKGDAVVVFLFNWPGQPDSFVPDNQGNPIAKFIVLRRNDSRKFF